MSGILGKQYKFTYGARNYVSGLAGVTATVLKPDGSLLGNYSLQEFSYPTMKGIYFFDIVTTDSMPEGEYSVCVKEGDYRSNSKVTMRLNYGLDLEETQEKLTGVIFGKSLTGVINVSKAISGVIQNKNIIGVIDSVKKLNGTILSQKIIGTIESDILTGVIVCSRS